MLALNRILLAIDGSEFSIKAIPVPGDLATAMHADVLVFHQLGREVEARMDAEVESGERAEDLVGWTVRALGHAGVVSVQSRIDVGILGQEARHILDVAEDFCADLIVGSSSWEAWATPTPSTRSRWLWCSEVT